MKLNERNAAIDRSIDMRPRQWVDNCGFTIIEMMVAIAISSIIILIIYSANRSIMTAVNDLTGVAEFYENVNLAITKIDRDLSSAYFDRMNKRTCFIAENDEYNDLKNGKMNFVTIKNIEFMIAFNIKSEVRQSDIREVGYFLKPDKEIQRLYHLMRREDFHYDEEPESGGETNVLLENVVDIKFEFKQGNDWVYKWNSKEMNNFPTAVRTTMLVKNYRGNEEKFTFISNINLRPN